MIDVGDTVPLNLQLFDGREDLKVIATVLNDSLEEIEQVELLHLKNGLYINRSLLMPAVQYLIANYIVYDGDKESEDYERSADVFYAFQKQQDIDAAVRPIIEAHMPLKNDYMVGQVEHEFQKDDFIEGKIINHDGN